MLLYIGTYTHLGGPGAAVVRAENGRFELLDACAAIPNPGYLALSEDGTTLYASSFSGEKQKGAAAFGFEEPVETETKQNPEGESYF